MCFSFLFIYEVITADIFPNLVNLVIPALFLFPILFAIYWMVLFIHEFSHYLVIKGFGAKDVMLDMFALRMGNGKIKIVLKDFVSPKDFAGCVFFKPNKMENLEDITTSRRHFVWSGLAGIIGNLISITVVLGLIFTEVIRMNILVFSFIAISFFVIMMATYGDVHTVIQGRKWGYHLMILIETYLMHQRHVLKFGEEDVKIIQYLTPILLKELSDGLDTYSKNTKDLMLQTLVNVSFLTEECVITPAIATDFLANYKGDEVTDVYTNVGVDYEEMYKNLKKLGF